MSNPNNPAPFAIHDRYAFLSRECDSHEEPTVRLVHMNQARQVVQEDVVRTSAHATSSWKGARVVDPTIPGHLLAMVTLAKKGTFARTKTRGIWSVGSQQVVFGMPLDRAKDWAAMHAALPKPYLPHVGPTSWGDAIHHIDITAAASLSVIEGINTLLSSSLIPTNALELALRALLQPTRPNAFLAYALIAPGVVVTE